MRDWWAKAAQASVGPINYHELRHTAISLYISSGASVLLCAKIAGHMDISITLNTYAGLFEQDIANVAKSLNQSAKAHIWHTAENSVATEKQTRL